MHVTFLPTFCFSKRQSHAPVKFNERPLYIKIMEPRKQTMNIMETFFKFLIFRSHIKSNISQCQMRFPFASICFGNKINNDYLRIKSLNALGERQAKIVSGSFSIIILHCRHIHTRE